MANREALRELQTRLAQRMQAARGEARVVSWLAVETAGQGYLFPLQQAGEIFPVVPLLAVPHAKAWFRGVANLRGSLHGVVDLSAFLGLPAADVGSESARLLALNPTLGVNAALLVERMAGLRSEGQLVRQPPQPGERPPFAGPVWRDESARSWQEIDLAALAGHGQFLGIAA